MSEDLRATVQAIKASGITTLGGIAKALQDRGIRTPAGNTTWHRVQVSRLLAVNSTEPAPIEHRPADNAGSTSCEGKAMSVSVTAALGFFQASPQHSPTECTAPPEPEPSNSVAVEITADHAFLPTGDDGNVGPGWESAADTERIKQGRRLMVPRAMADWLRDHKQAMILPAGAVIPPYVRPGTPGR